MGKRINDKINLLDKTIQNSGSTPPPPPFNHSNLLYLQINIRLLQLRLSRSK